MGINRRGVVIMVFLASIAGGMIAVGGYTMLFGTGFQQPEYDSIEERQKVTLTNNTNALTNTNTIPNAYAVPDGLNFISAAEATTKGVVHIRARYENPVAYNGFLRGRGMPQVSSGSGVIISDDGYIATNNHVVEEADYLQVTLSDNRRYEAEIIGTDPSTDLALIKIKENDLEFIPYGDSDKTQIGEWVLAVGNPFELTSTVTAGIVSAKARNIGILAQENGLQIESFIQTDAAVNPGNSGGALVDLSGKLVGINTAIASRTGSYSGYSFAIPVALVKKVMDDLLEFGVVQRALLGIRIVDASLVSQDDRYDVDLVNGVFVASVNSGSAAEDAGIEAGDVIIKIGNKTVNNVQELQELVARNRPGDQIAVTYVRNDKEKTMTATLKNVEGSTRVVEQLDPFVENDYEGVILEEISNDVSEDLGIEGGVKIKEIKAGAWKESGIEEGFIITEIDKAPVRQVSDVTRILKDKSGERVVILGYDKYGDKSYYTMKW